ncbi:patatin [Bizionia saleffrena]|uniref:Patatin n=1 Tax=Bizionia saleffrena TaxID=291189 RepID=A0A8H2LMS9_9FLAO|nr:patatin-like phospholipase family protein [Bizionia saleffrena]TYB76011.1 patatin [Bizionia saleffrena]
MKYLIILTLLLVVLSGNIYAQNDGNKEPKVGLVLSGGGAKGLAHIGALKVIDSLGIRVDYVAGTSMGAIVGSLYASGYSGKQLDSIFKRVDFSKIINDNIPREAKTFYERENYEKYAVTLPFDNFSLKLPSALSRGQNTFNLLSRLTLHVSNTDDFSKLPIPFFCIATNIENGQPVILDKGNLALAVKASGAFPSLFQPVLINDELLIDGGVVNNYPIDELRAKGMDVIIGVDVQDGLAKRTDLSSAAAILFQINNFRTINDMKEKSKKTDIYIKPDITKFTVVSFDLGEKIIENGEAAAVLKIPELKVLAGQQIKEPLEITEHKVPDSLQINDIYFEGLHNYTMSYVLGKFKFKPSEKITYDAFVSGTNNLVGTNNFDSFNYKLKPSKKKGVDGYDLYTELKETKKTASLKLGLHYDGLYKSALLVNITNKQLLFKSDVLSFDFIVGDNVRYNFDYYIDKGHYWSIGVSSEYSEFQANVSASGLLTPEELTLSGVNKLNTQLSDLSNRFFVQTQYKNDFKITLGAQHQRLKISTETVIAESNKETYFDKSDYVSLYGNITYDSFDDKYYPSKGFYLNGDFNIYLYSSDYNKDFSEFSVLSGKLGYAQSFSDKFSASIINEAGLSINSNQSSSFDYILGGYAKNFVNNLKSFYGYDFLSIRGNSYIKATIQADYEVFKKNHILLAANYANIENDLFDTVGWFAWPTYSGYALGYGVETFLGPIEARYTWSPDTQESYWFFNLGFWF